MRRFSLVWVESWRFIAPALALAVLWLLHCAGALL